MTIGTEHNEIRYMPKEKHAGIENLKDVAKRVGKVARRAVLPATIAVGLAVTQKGAVASPEKVAAGLVPDDKNVPKVEQTGGEVAAKTEEALTAIPQQKTFASDYGINVTIENNWTEEQKGAIKQRILQSEKALNELFGPPVSTLGSDNYRIVKKTPEMSRRLMEEIRSRGGTPYALDQLWGYTSYEQETNTWIITIDEAPLKEGIKVGPTKAIDHEIVHAWMGQGKMFAPITNYDVSTDPGHPLGLFYIFNDEQLAFIGQDFLESKIEGKPFTSIDKTVMRVFTTDPQFFRKLRDVLETEKEDLPSDRQLNWQEAMELVNKASPNVGKIFIEGVFK